MSLDPSYVAYLVGMSLDEVPEVRVTHLGLFVGSFDVGNCVDHVLVVAVYMYGVVRYRCGVYNRHHFRSLDRLGKPCQRCLVVFVRKLLKMHAEASPVDSRVVSSRAVCVDMGDLRRSELLGIPQLLFVVHENRAIGLGLVLGDHSGGPQTGELGVSFDAEKLVEVERFGTISPGAPLVIRVSVDVWAGPP